jgi:phosphatidylserine/phosphatidylglycerophosphate/cardiolipin synthase-like enzyme
MYKLFKKISILLVLHLSVFSQPSCLAAYFPEKTLYQVCFTPGQNCTEIIVELINNAKKSVYIQAYSFTSAPIATALVSAKRRGLDIQVLLDKSQIKNNKYSSAKFLMNNDIKTWIDYKPAIAHNKIIIIDNKIVITGSFNFTKAAQERNAENLLVINDVDLANIYYMNWLKRKGLSDSPELYLNRRYS